VSTKTLCESCEAALDIERRLIDRGAIFNHAINENFAANENAVYAKDTARLITDLSGGSSNACVRALAESASVY